MGKKKKALSPKKVAKRLDALAEIIADKSRPKPERKAAKAEAAALIEKHGDPYLAATLATPAEDAQPPVAEPDPAEIVKAASEAPPAEQPEPAEVIAAAERVLVDANASDGAIASARAAKKRAERALKIAAAKAAAEAPEPEADEVDPAEHDARIARRVQAKRALRKAGLLVEAEGGELSVDPDAVPRDSAELVAAYNELIGTTTGHYLTSDDERAAIDARIRLVTSDPPATIEGAVEATPAQAARDAKLASEPRYAPKPGADDEYVELPEPVTIAEHEAVEVVTETGREFAVGEPVAEAEPAPDSDFAAPSQAERQLEEGRNGYKIVLLNEAGEPDLKRDGTPRTVRQYTRVTTYIDNLEDKTALPKWKMRVLLEGIVRNETTIGTAAPDETVPEHLLAKVRDLIHVRDHAIAKAHKADRKGKLGVGELGALLDDAAKAYRDGVNEVAEQALELGGVSEKADKGTALHALTEVYDEHGIEPIADMLERGEISPADFADLEAYGRAMKAAGVKVLEREVVVVNDELRVAGRLDKIVLARADVNAKRAVRMVADVKTGSVEYAPGKIAQQLELYATSEGYDLETYKRRPLNLSRTKALLIHLPAGRAECRVYVVDLVAGRAGNKLSGEVRRWRNEGKRSIDFSVDLAAPAPVVEGDES